MTSIPHFSRDSSTIKLGGAETSTKLFFKENFDKDVNFFSIAEYFKIDTMSFRINKLIYIESLILFLISLFYRKKVGNLFPRGVSCHSTHVPSILSLVRYSNCEKYVFFRSEYDFYAWRNYHTGHRWLLKFLINLLEVPFGSVYNAILKSQLKTSNCTIIANSIFMQKTLHRRLGVHAKVHLPIVKTPKRIPLEEYDQAVSAFFTQQGRFLIVFAYEIVKGKRVVEYLRRNLPKDNFIIVDRSLNSIQKFKNTLFLPHSAENTGLLYYVDLVLIPSQWQEAYGRISREATLAKVNSLVSRVGGLTETSSEYTTFVDDFKNPDAWLKILKDD